MECGQKPIQSDASQSEATRGIGFCRSPYVHSAGNVSRRILASGREIFSSILAAAALKKIYSFTFRGSRCIHGVMHFGTGLPNWEEEKCKCTLGKRRIWRNNTEAGRNVVGRVGVGVSKKKLADNFIGPEEGSHDRNMLAFQRRSRDRTLILNCGL